MKASTQQGSVVVPGQVCVRAFFIIYSYFGLRDWWLIITDEHFCSWTFDNCNVGRSPDAGTKTNAWRAHLPSHPGFEKWLFSQFLDDWIRNSINLLVFCRLFTINSWTFFHSVMENCCPSRVFIFSLGRTCSPPAVSYLIYTCSPAAPAQWVGRQDHRNAAGDRQRGTAPHARGSCQSSGKGSACTADSITQDKYLNMRSVICYL